MPIANASLLDEATAAAEAMTLAKRSAKSKSDTIIVAGDCHPQTIELVKTRAEPLGLKVVVGFAPKLMEEQDYFAVLVQYPSTVGQIHDMKPYADAAHAKGAVFIAAADLLALTLLTPPGEWGADIVIGSSQRFGVPFGYGGPHAAFLACQDAFKRNMPGRLVGLSQDAQGNPALRLALQTREQHIRREKATSNICTAQVLLAVMASMYAVYHGPSGLKRIAQRTHRFATIARDGLVKLGFECPVPHFFDTFIVKRPPPVPMLSWCGKPLQVRRLISPSTLWTPLFKKSCPQRCSARAPSSRTRSSTATTPKPRCCATSAACPTRTSRWTAP
jgi:glycine dehydrogenase